MKKINKRINEKKAQQIVDALECPQKRKEMLVHQHFPLERVMICYETKEGYIESRYQQIIEECKRANKKRK